MALREIVIYPDPRLERRCEPVGVPAGEGAARLAELVRDMAETMYAADGVGLAAIQVGELVRVFVIDAQVAGGTPQDAPLVFVDPEILWLSDEREEADEGCLSFPGVYVPVERALRCRTRARDLAGNTFEMEGEDLFARALQHEQDHLDGKLIAHYVGRLKRKLIERRLVREAREP